MDMCAFVPRNPSITVRGVAIPLLIVGNAAYPLHKWLMKPFETIWLPEGHIRDWHQPEMWLNVLLED